MALLCRELGLRRPESSLLDLHRANHQAVHLRRVNIIEGTKGGRGNSADRWVPVSEHGMIAIQRAIDAADGDSKLIPADIALGHWMTRVSKQWTNVAIPLGLGNLWELRAAYACDRYAQLTDSPAPAVAGERAAVKMLDQAARSTLSLELGHNRIDVLAAYVGPSK